MKQKNLDPAGLYARCLTTNMSSLSSDIVLDDPNTINEEQSDESESEFNIDISKVGRQEDADTIVIETC